MRRKFWTAFRISVVLLVLLCALPLSKAVVLAGRVPARVVLEEVGYALAVNALFWLAFLTIISGVVFLWGAMQRAVDGVPPKRAFLAKVGLLLVAIAVGSTLLLVRIASSPRPSVVWSRSLR